jgi:NAD(P)-dependent dehydrogenase (short-subunit alcohol dehydrogenase family)
VIIASRGLASNQAFARELDPSGRRALAVELDIMSAPSIAAAAERVTARHGVLDVLVNNAASGAGAAIDRMGAAEWDSAFEGNAWGYFACSRAFGLPMVAAGRGSIVNVSSILGIRAVPASVFAATPERPAANYATAKAAVIGLTTFLAGQWGPAGVRVNTVTPGACPPEDRLTAAAYKDALVSRVPLGRLGRPEDIGGVVLFWPATPPPT